MTRFKYFVVVVGAVVANRLSEVSEWNILLVEAGQNAPIELDVPLLLVTRLKFPETYWNFITQPQKYAHRGKLFKHIT